MSEKTIIFDKLGDFILSELVITDKGNMIIDYEPPYPKEEKDEKRIRRDKEKNI